MLGGYRLFGERKWQVAWYQAFSALQPSIGTGGPEYFCFAIKQPQFDCRSQCRIRDPLSCRGGVDATRRSLLAKALTEGRTAMVAPVVTSYGIVTTILAWAGGERLTAYQFIGIAICAFGVMAVGLGHSNPASRLNRREGRQLFLRCWPLVFTASVSGFKVSMRRPL